jgi:hemolysin III
MHDRPFLKGKLHALATVYYLAWVYSMRHAVPPNLRVPLWYYFFGLVGHFAVSAVYHMVRWHPHHDIIPRRIDHVMIFVKISCAYHAIIATIAPDMNPWVVLLFDICTVIGIGSRALLSDNSSRMMSVPYVLIGWLITLDYSIVERMTRRAPDGIHLVYLGGLFYTVGAGIYLAKPRSPLPSLLGFHEVFHICTIAGAHSYLRYLWEHAVPYYESIQ